MTDYANEPDDKWRFQIDKNRARTYVCLCSMYNGGWWIWLANKWMIREYQIGVRRRKIATTHDDLVPH